MHLGAKTESNLPGIYLPQGVKKLPPLNNLFSPAALITAVAKPKRKNATAKIFILLNRLISLDKLNVRALLTDVVDL